MLLNAPLIASRMLLAARKYSSSHLRGLQTVQAKACGPLYRMLLSTDCPELRIAKILRLNDFGILKVSSRLSGCAKHAPITCQHLDGELLAWKVNLPCFTDTCLFEPERSMYIDWLFLFLYPGSSLLVWWCSFLFWKECRGGTPAWGLRPHTPLFTTYLWLL